MQLTITINCDNDAFQEDPIHEVSRVLHEYAASCGMGGKLADRTLMDLNGQPVGEVTVVDLDVPFVTDQLAAAFCRMIWVEIGDEDMEIVIQENAADHDKTICHTHDYVDANQVMIDAWNRLRAADLLPGIEVDDPSHMAIFNNAWLRARNADFKLEGYHDGFFND